MENPQQFDALIRRLWTLWGPLAAAPWLVAAIAAARPAPDEQAAGMRLPFLGLSGVMSLACVGTSFVLPARIREQSLGRGAEPGAVFTTSFIIANALCEAGGLAAAVFFLVTRWPPFLGFTAIGTFGALAQRPSLEALRDWFQQARRAARPPPTGGTP